MADLALLRRIIKDGETINAEFKRSKDSLSRSVYDSICAFLNRKGGHVFLGVGNDRKAEGINHDSLEEQLNTLTKDLNNPQIINPPFTLVPEPVVIDGKDVIYLYVPESPSAHTCKGVYYDRNHEGDFVLRTQHQIANLFLRKEKESYTENRVFPDLTLDDFDHATLDEVRAAATGHARGGVHPWTGMSDKELLESAGMWRKDNNTGKYGYTLAALVLFGKESVIFNYLPQYETDVLCKIRNTELYDDRDQVRCNLIGAYHRIMSFIEKYLPEMPYIEGTKRISLRDTIFREVVCNLLVHREFSNGYKASLSIFSDRVETRNWNLPHQMGRISPENLSPQPKNRAIANVFTQMGLVEELGSGTRKMFTYCPLMLPGSVPVLDEDDVFTAIIPISIPTVSAQSDLSDNLSDSLSDNQRKVLQMIIRNNNVTAPEMAEALSISRNTVNTAVARLKALGIVKRIGGAFGGHWEIIAPNGSAAETKS